MEGTPAFFSQMQSFVGGNTATMRMVSRDQDGAEVFVEEEKSKDNETNHLEESVGYMAVWNTDHHDEPELEFAEIDLDHEWQTVTLSHTFENPVVLMGALSFNGHHPTTLRVRNVQSGSFDVRISEWLYLDNWHTTETVSYLVVESGFWNLADGGSYDAGVAFVDGSPTSVVFNCPTSMTDPIVFTQIVTSD